MDQTDLQTLREFCNAEPTPRSQGDGANSRLFSVCNDITRLFAVDHSVLRERDRLKEDQSRVTGIPTEARTNQDKTNLGELKKNMQRLGIGTADVWFAVYVQHACSRTVTLESPSSFVLDGLTVAIMNLYDTIRRWFLAAPTSNAAKPWHMVETLTVVILELSEAAQNVRGFKLPGFRLPLCRSRQSIANSLYAHGLEELDRVRLPLPTQFDSWVKILSQAGDVLDVQLFLSDQAVLFVRGARTVSKLY